MPSLTSQKDSSEKVNIILAAMEDKKAIEPEAMELGEDALIADFFVVTNGTSSIHMRSIADGVAEAMKDRAEQRARREGHHDADWMILDYGDVVVHIFSEEARGRYHLDSLWRSTEEGRASEE